MHHIKEIKQNLRETAWRRVLLIISERSTQKSEENARLGSRSKLNKDPNQAQIEQVAQILLLSTTIRGVKIYIVLQYIAIKYN